MVQWLQADSGLAAVAAARLCGAERRLGRELGSDLFSIKRENAFATSPTDSASPEGSVCNGLATPPGGAHDILVRVA